jgi:hypothetical protein
MPAPPPQHGLWIIRRARAHRRWFHKWIAVATVGTVACLALFLLLMARPRTADTGPAAATALHAEPLPPLEPPLIAVTAECITVDGTEVARTADVAAAGRVVRVDGVFDALKARRLTAREPEHSAVLRVDDDVSAIVVKCVFQTAAFAGYDDLRFAVSRDGGPDPSRP